MASLHEHKLAADPAFAPHDHSHCAGDVLARAEVVLVGAGARLTPVRKRVLEILLEAHRAMGAYDVLQRLAAEGFGNQPPVAYRALEFLVEHGPPPQHHTPGISGTLANAPARDACRP